MTSRATRLRVDTLFPSNGALLRACRRGDDLAWRELVDRYERLVYAIPLREGLDRDAAADVTQDTFAALISGMHTIKDPDRLAWWLMTVARRLSWRVRNGSTSREVDLDVDPASDDDLPQELATVEWVYDAVQSLSEPCRSLVTALFLDAAEPSYAEIAVGLGRPVGSIGPMRGRCLRVLAELLEAAS